MKSIAIRISLFALIWAILSIVSATWQEASPLIRQQASIQTLNGGSSEFITHRLIDQASVIPGAAVSVILALVFLGLFAGPIFRTAKRALSSPAALVILIAASLSSCLKPVNVPQFEEIANNETAFVVPLEGDLKSQAKFQSEEQLEKQKVALKRVQVEKRWQTTGRYDYEGEWMPTMRVVKVDRSPVTREWKAPEDQHGKAIKSSAADKAIWVESADSVGFSMGFNCTAFIKEEDAAKFLYMYAGNSLSVVMDQEIRARVQQVAAEVAAIYPLDLLRAKKQEMIDKVKADIVPFFALRGITITTIGMFGGMTYENPKIQDSIDATFVAQQEKVNTAAQLEAQKSKNEIIIQESLARAQAAQNEAEGKAKAFAAEAKGKAEAIELETKALAAAQQNPAFLQLRTLDMTRSFLERWDGKYPSYYIGGPQNVSGLLSIPSLQGNVPSALK